VPIAWRVWPVIDSVWELLGLSTVLVLVPLVTWSLSGRTALTVLCTFAVGAVTWRLRVVPPERRLHDGAVAVPTISSPMPGSVISVLVASGDQVEADQPLLIVEAMKMEHVLKAPSAGIVRLDAAIGDHVERGQLLSTIEAEGS
jgi:acetyl/propionyl-CoA carboxylase alpha subunit